jgi:hypothetical protein
LRVCDVGDGRDQSIASVRAISTEQSGTAIATSTASATVPIPAARSTWW